MNQLKLAYLSQIFFFSWSIGLVESDFKFKAWNVFGLAFVKCLRLKKLNSKYPTNTDKLRTHHQNTPFHMSHYPRIKWSQADSNRWPPACHAGALPSELWPHDKFFLVIPIDLSETHLSKCQSCHMLPVAVIPNSAQ